MTTAARKPLRGIKAGIVTSDKRAKSRTVVVSFLAKHPKYGKYIRHRSSYQVHDPQNVSKVGDRVEIVACRPISKTKMWRLVRVVGADLVAPELPATPDSVSESLAANAANQGSNS